MSSDEKQKSLRLAFGVHRGPKDAPAQLLRQIESEGQAIAISMRAGGHKLAYIAAAMGKSESYVSLLRAGKRTLPAKHVSVFCAASGSNLLAQYRELQAALTDCANARLDRLAAMLSEAA